jgi:uncharacterized OB-fold protein
VRKVFSVFFLFTAVPISAQSDTCFDPNSKAYYRCERNIERICKDFLVEDLIELEEKLLAVHPDPFAYCGKEALGEAYKKAFDYYSEDRTMIQHAQNLNRFIRVVEDSHLQTHVFRLLFESCGYDSGFLPLFIQPIDGKFYVEEDYIGGPPVGSEIISVGKLSMMELHALSKQWSVDEGQAMNASNEAAPYYYTPSQFFANPTQQEGDFESIVFQNEGKLDSVTVTLVSPKELQKIRRDYFNQNKKNVEATFYLNEGKAILKVHSFSSRPFQNDVKKIRKFFQATRELGIRDIAIDVRDNPGGSSAMVEYLCSFLMPNGLNTPSNIIWKSSDYSYQIVSNFRMKHFPKSTEKRFKRNEDMYQYYLLSQTPLKESDTAFFSIPQRQRQEQVYTGKLSVFMNGNTVSAACDFAQLLQNNHRAKLIGTPCNATANGTWGNAAAVQLTESGITHSVPTIRYNYNNSFSYSRTPILPNVSLEQNLEDLKSRKDTFLEFFLQN